MYTTIKRCFFVALSLVIQILFNVYIMLYFYKNITLVQFVVLLLSVIIVLNIVKNSKNLNNDLPWIITILITPVFGTLIYISIGESILGSKTLKNIYLKEKEAKKYYKIDPDVTKELEDKNLDKLKYFNNYLNIPVTTNNKITYYEIGEKFYPEFIKELKKAEKFIFMEYFIINTKSSMWLEILEILKEKAVSGVDVRVMYDDAGSITVLPTTYKKYLESLKIKCVTFNELKSFRGLFMNNRDHRKITVIDGKVGFTGGVNLADEYLNIGSKYGHWKDNAIKLVGDSVWSLTVLFLTNWNAYRNEDKDYTKFKYEFKDIKKDGYIVCYGSSPITRNAKIAVDVYLNIINQAQKYLYIMTPYLIIDSNVINSLILAVKRGVDVKIIVPSIPDKKIVYSLTKSYIKNLVDEGVSVYTYTPGFVHAKVFVSDDKVATVGTINMDYRSLYLHFENGVYIENNKVIKDIKLDAINTINKSHKVTKKEVKYGIFKDLWQSILRIFAPLF